MTSPRNTVATSRWIIAFVTTMALMFCQYTWLIAAAVASIVAIEAWTTKAPSALGVTLVAACAFVMHQRILSALHQHLSSRP